VARPLRAPATRPTTEDTMAQQKRKNETDDEATGIPNRTGPGTDPEPTPPRGAAKEDVAEHGERKGGDRPND
jgi:hypothetical protein